MFRQLIDVWGEDLAWVWISALPRQAALILGVAILVRVCPRMPATWRHWMWLAATLAIGLLPLAAVLLPRWPLIPAEWVYGADALGVSQATAAELGGVSNEAMAVYGMGGAFSFGWVGVCFLAWLGVVLLLLARLVAGMMGLRSFQRDRLPVYKGRLCARLERCRRLARVTTLVDLYTSKRSPLPMTWGVIRPVINLPEESETWSDERLDAVFLHELGHIERADCWTNMVLKIVCALNWFNPFVWMAARRTYLAQEVACDDFACNRLRPSDYARHLLELTVVVKDFRRREIEPAVGLSSCDHLRIRVAAVLDPRRSRRSLPSTTASFISSAVFLSMAVMAMVSLRFVDESRAAAQAFPVKEVDEEELGGLQGGVVEWDWSKFDLEGWLESLASTGSFPVLAPEETLGFGETIATLEPLTMLELSELAGDAADSVEGEGNSYGGELGPVFADQPPRTEALGEDGIVPGPAARPLPVVAGEVVVAPAVVLPLKVALTANRFADYQAYWRRFQRRVGKGRGGSVVPGRVENPGNHSARLSLLAQPPRWLRR